MQTSIASSSPFLYKISFDDAIERLTEESNRHRGSVWVTELLQEVAAHPPLREGMEDVSFIRDNEALIGRLLSDYFPPSLAHSEIKAAAIPFSPIIFNLTKRFQDILHQAGHSFEMDTQKWDAHQLYIMNCCLILNKVYGTQLDFYTPLFYDMPTQEGITRHYRMLYDTDTLHIIPTEKSIPLSPSDIDLLVSHYDDVALWKEKFPPNSWIMKGFSILTLYDATVENAVSVFKEKLLSVSTHEFQQSIDTIFRSIYQVPDIRIGFTLYHGAEKKFSRTGLTQKLFSFLLGDKDEAQSSMVLDESAHHRLLMEQKYFAVGDTNEFHQQHPELKWIKNLHDQHIRSFILAPVVKNGTVFAILEVVSGEPGKLHSVNANRLAVVLPSLTAKMEQLVVELENKIQAYIQDKFTTIHRSVNWIFRSEARKHLAAALQGGNQPSTEIIFEKIYPLYGQVDIKGSSVARNQCVQKDLIFQLKAILILVDQLQHQVLGSALELERSTVEQLLYRVTSDFKVNIEPDVISYLENILHPLFHRLSPPEGIVLVNKYFAETNKDTGTFYSFRRKYEFTITAINDRLALILDSGQEQAQHSFPHYYERFKADGIDHNLYIGDSLSPQHTFTKAALQQLRMWQLRIICQMERAHYELMPTLPYALSVTSLIVVYNTTIAIRFRMDEKRFDVEGSYNIRYEVVKKRIDKAKIRNSEERIAMPGKITIIFSSPEEITEYQHYINELQQESILSYDIEEFDVEDLQGISGLKALRVGLLRSSQ